MKTTQHIKLLIVDDSALMRKLLAGIFSQHKEFEIRTARDGIEALTALHAFQPQVISLDINMPGKDGLECLERIMIERPTPVVMFSSLTAAGATTTLEAMTLGAVDYMLKPDGAVALTLDNVAIGLVEKIRIAAHAKIRRSRGLVQRLREQNLRAAPVIKSVPAIESPVQIGKGGVVLIGVSTGGPRTLEEILPQLPSDFAWPVVVAQHMPATFTGALAKRMNDACLLRVVEVNKPQLLEAGTIYIGKGDADVILSRRSQCVMVLPAPSNPNHLWHPSVDVLVKSAKNVFVADQIIGVLLTGMGNDGAAEMADLKIKGGRTIAESEETAIIFGMPYELIERGGADMILPADKITGQLTKWLQ